MKKLFVLLVIVFAVTIQAPPINAEMITAVNYGEMYNCPDDGCTLYYTGRDLYCVGSRCRHVQIYKCGCCNKEWQVYVN